jgi:hypothetical protein
MVYSVNLLPSQSFQSLFGVNPRDDIPNLDDTFHFIEDKLSHVLKGQPVEKSPPPPLSIRCSHINEVRKLITAFASLTDVYS